MMHKSNITPPPHLYFVTALPLFLDHNIVVGKHGKHWSTDRLIGSGSVTWWRWNGGTICGWTKVSPATSNTLELITFTQTGSWFVIDFVLYATPRYLPE